MNMKKSILLMVVCCCTQLAGMAQCFPDRHSTNFYDGWISCETGNSPNALRGPGHFIMYDFGKLYALGHMKIWNTNDPSHLDWGMRDVVIDYSRDGETWTEAGKYTFEQGTGSNTYEGFNGPDLGGIEAQYLLITAVNNYGGTCYGFAELKIDAEEVIIDQVENVNNLECVDLTVFPNPFTDYVSMTVSPGCSGDLKYTVYDVNGKMISSAKMNLVPGQAKSAEVGEFARRHI